MNLKSFPHKTVGSFGKSLGSPEGYQGVITYLRMRWLFFGFGWSKLEGSGIPGVWVKSVDTRKKAECEGISLGLN